MNILLSVMKPENLFPPDGIFKKITDVTDIPVIGESELQI